MDPSIHLEERRERRGRRIPALAVIGVVAVLGASLLGLFGFLETNAAFGTVQDLESRYICDAESYPLEFPAISRLSEVYTADRVLLGKLTERNSQPASLDEVPDMVIDALLAAEDADFYQHEGIDFKAIFRAALANIRGDGSGLQGGSTITQQVVKQNFLSSEQTIERKICEAVIAAELERRYTKDQILEFYMNSVYFGSGAYGVQTAAREFFAKDLYQIQIHEAAALAVLVRNPTLYNPRLRPEITLERRDSVISQMLEEGWISQGQALWATRQPLGVVDSPLRRGEADHVVAEVKRQLLNDDDFSFLGETSEERKIAIFGCPADDVACEGGGGYQIHTTIDLDLQKEANRILNQWLPLPPYEQNLAACGRIFDDFEENQAFYTKYAEVHSCMPTGALTMVDNHTGAVKVMASGLPFEFSQFDLAVQGRRNPGSSFKPFGLVAALEEGYTLGHFWSGESPIEIECEFICSPDGTNIWTVHNYGSSRDVITLGQATYSSVNAVYAQVSDAVGPEKIVDVARRMGVTESALNPVLSIVLGSSAVTTLEMASAYSNFATNGLHADDYIISKIVDHEGNVVYEHRPDVTQIGDPAVFAAARRPLENVPKIGTAPRANIGRAQGGKTGTHQSHRDAWYVGFTPEYTTAVWVGFEAEQKELEDVVINGQNYDRVTGGRVPAPIWAEFMLIALEGLPESTFPTDPANIGDYLTPPQTVVPVLVGLEQDEAEKLLRIEARLNVEVVEVPSLEPPGIVVNQDLAPGELVEQGEFVTIYVSTGEVPVAPMPNLIGMTVPEAIEFVAQFELNSGVRLTVVVEKVPAQFPSHVDRVVATNPAPGTQITRSATVLLSVGE